MLKGKLKWAMVPMVAVATIASLSAFTSRDESSTLHGIVHATYCKGNISGCYNGNSNDCDTGSGNCTDNSCPSGTTEVITKPGC